MFTRTLLTIAILLPLVGCNTVSYLRERFRGLVKECITTSETLAQAKEAAIEAIENGAITREGVREEFKDLMARCKATIDLDFLQ